MTVDPTSAARQRLELLDAILAAAEHRHHILDLVYAAADADNAIREVAAFLRVSDGAARAVVDLSFRRFTGTALALLRREHRELIAELNGTPPARP